MIFMTESEGQLLAKDKLSTVEVRLPVPKGRGAKLAVLAFDGRRLRLGLGFIGCRSNRSGLTKTLGQSRLHEVLFWPDRCLPGSDDPEDAAALAALHRYMRWTF